MKIDTPDNDYDDLEQVKLDLHKFIIQDDVWQSPPCPSCENHIPDNCGPSCVDAPTTLSIDPVLYPIERNVIAIVYELNATRLLKTCWSCEGHMRDTENNLWKVPQVCFNSQTAIYPKLLSSYLSKLYIQKRLKYSWNIILSEISQSIYPTYCLRPDLNTVTEPSLGQLQNDLKKISIKLHMHLKAEAQSLLKSIENR